MCVEGSFLQDWRVFSFGLVSLTFWSAAAAVVFPLLSSLPSSLTHLYLSSISSSSLSLGTHQKERRGQGRKRGEARRSEREQRLLSLPLPWATGSSLFFLTIVASSSFSRWRWWDGKSQWWRWEEGRARKTIINLRKREDDDNDVATDMLSPLVLVYYLPVTGSKSVRKSMAISRMTKAHTWKEHVQSGVRSMFWEWLWLLRRNVSNQTAFIFSGWLRKMSRGKHIWREDHLRGRRRISYRDDGTIGSSNGWVE